ncbi:MAG: TonB-dependent receptor, partial [Phenylobacterium sp.]
MLQKRLLAGLGLASLVCAPAGSEALAQEWATEEVIVTAQRRGEPLQDVPLTVTVLSGEVLSNLGIDTPAKLASQTPGFKVSTVFG